MSIITLQFGQCGNQIGNILYEELYNDIKIDGNKTGVSKRVNVDYVAESVNKWFNVSKNGTWNVRSILVDTENKVVSNVNNNGYYKFRNIVAGSHGGAANNWAYGYCAKSELLLDDIRDGVRNEMEKCAGVTSIMGLLGSAGGTGSGVGTKVLEMMRDEYPNKVIVSAVVLPYTRGEVVTQNYNSLLTLTKLYSVSDGIYLYENDVMHRMCAKALSATNVTFQDINKIIAQQLAATFQPLENTNMWNIIRSLTSHPSYKLIQIRSAPHIAQAHLKYESATTWPILVGQIRSALKCFDLQDCKVRFNKRLKCAGNVFISRGCEDVSEEVLRPVADSVLYVPWLPSQCLLSKFHQSRNFKDIKKFVTFLTNNNYVCCALDSILNDAWTLFTSGAYLHHYQKFNIDEQYFSEAFEEFENISNLYKNL